MLQKQRQRFPGFPMSQKTSGPDGVLGSDGELALAAAMGRQEAGAEVWRDGKGENSGFGFVDLWLRR